MNEYDKQAEDFLKSTGTTLEINFAYTGPYFSNDKEFRDVYSFTLRNDKGVYSAQFGDSIRNTQRRKFASPSNGHPVSFMSEFYGSEEKRVKKLGFKLTSSSRLDAKEIRAAREHKPSAYDILACIGGYVPEVFEDFCAEFGYGEQPLSEYPGAMDVFTKCQTEARGMRQLFDAAQRDQLAEIA